MDILNQLILKNVIANMENSMKGFRLTRLFSWRYKMGVIHLLPAIRINFDIEEKEFGIYFAWLIWRLEYIK